MTRRSVLAGATGLATIAAAPGAPMGAIVETAQGRVRGLQAGPVHVFKGIRYGASTEGANRFRPPQPPPQWSGVQDAVEYGPTAPQPSRAVPEAFAWYWSKVPQSEDCLVLNVFTPSVNDRQKRPVMVWFHGGGFTSGAGTAKGFDGSNLAQHGDVVVVTVNHRLNVLGHFLPDHADESFRDGGNAGELDLVAALRWVRTNISRFGGDSGNVTIFGQSGGGSKVAVLMAMPAAKGLFHRAIIESASSGFKVAEPADTARAAELLMKQMDVTSPAALREMPAGKLLAAMTAAIKANGGIDNFRPMRDGRSLPVHPFSPSAPALSSHVPLLIGTAQQEAAFYMASDMANFSMTREKAVARAGKFVGVDAPSAEKLFAAYEASHPGASPSQVYIAIHSDQMYRRNDIRAAELRAATAQAPTFMYWFTWKTPVMDGVLSTPHTLEVPFAFHNVDLVSELCGSGPEQNALQDRVMGAWVAFARHGNPSHKGLPRWTPYSAKGRETMILDNECRVVSDPGKQDRETITQYPPYEPESLARRS